MKPIQIVGFTPLGVILAERLTYSQRNISLIEQASIDTHWQSVSLFCLINLLKKSRILLSDSSKKFGINIQTIKMNEQLVYSYLKLATQRVQKYYLTLLKQRQIKLFRDLFTSSSSTVVPLPDKNYLTYMTYGHSSHVEFDQSPRLNAFHAIFQYLLTYPSIKLIGPDIFSFEFAHLLSSLGHNQVYLYRMNLNETSLIPISETNGSLVTLFQVFSKFIHEPLIQTDADENHRPTLHIIEHFHQFKMNLNAEGQLEYEILTERTPEETKKHKRTYLETFRQRTQESFTKFDTSNIHIDVKEEPLDHFPPSSTFFILPDINTSSDHLKTPSKLPSPLLPKAIRTFNSTPGALIQNIYTTLRTIANDETIPDLTNLFLSVDHELCVIQNRTTHRLECIVGKNDEIIIESQQHDLQRPVENLHNLHKIIQRPVNQSGQLVLYESQLFQNDALDLQSLLLLFNPQQTIPRNELMFLFHNEHDWHNQLVLPNRLTVNNNNQRNSIL